MGETFFFSLFKITFTLVFSRLGVFMHQSGPVAGTQMAFSSRLNFRAKGQKVLILICPFPFVYLFSLFSVHLYSYFGHGLLGTN